MSNPNAPGRGGRPASGRRKGSVNKVTSARQLLAKARAAGEETPLDFLLRVMRDEVNTLDVRVNAAKAAAPYVHPALKSIEVSGPGGGEIEFKVTLAFD